MKSLANVAFDEVQRPFLGRRNTLWIRRPVVSISLCSTVYFGVAPQCSREIDFPLVAFTECSYISLSNPNCPPVPTDAALLATLPMAPYMPTECSPFRIISVVTDILGVRTCPRMPNAPRILTFPALLVIDSGSIKYTTVSKLQSAPRPRLRLACTWG